MSYGHLFSSLCILTTIQDKPTKTPINYSDYLELVDWSGRAIRDDKAGAIADNLSPILARLRIEQPLWPTILPGCRRDGQTKTVCSSAGTVLDERTVCGQVRL